MNHMNIDYVHGSMVNSSPIFVLSYGRSGSTLLRYLIDTHPRIACPAEINLGSLCDKLFHTTYYTLGQVLQDSNNIGEEQVALAETRKIVTSLMSDYVKAKGKDIWCERSPFNINHISIINKVFPDAKYICLHRNCLDFVSSYLALNRFDCGDLMVPYVHRNPKSILSAVIEYWIDKTDILTAHEGKHVEQCLRIKYEDLVTYPSRSVDDIFRFIDIEWDVDILKSAFREQHDDGPGDTKIRYTDRINSDSIGKGASIPPDFVDKSYILRVNSIHKDLGYQSIEGFYDTHREKVTGSCNALYQDAENIQANEGIDKYIGKYSEAFQAIKNDCMLTVTGGKGGRWICGPHLPNVRAAQSNENASCEIIVGYNTFKSILDRSENVIDSYNEGKIQVTGDLEIAEQFGRALLGL